MAALPRRPALACAALVLCSLSIASSGFAADADGPDCDRPIQDFGDAPEGLQAYPTAATIGWFPTCLEVGAIGTRTGPCPPLGSAPGPTGFMRHVASPNGNFWLVANPAAPQTGVDSESDGKASLGGPGCSGVPVDGTDFYGYGQDEGTEFDGDGGVVGSYFVTCQTYQPIWLVVSNCGSARTVYLNVLADLDRDGDWNDSAPACDPTAPGCMGTCVGWPPCAQEWAVKNLPVSVTAGLSWHTAPVALGARIGFLWMRVSITEGPVDDDYPWAGSANRPGGAYMGGETEDVLVYLDTPDPVRRSTWGQLKLHYHD